MPEPSSRASSRPLHIGIVGFGTFGQFLAERFVKAGHRVCATSRRDYGAAADELGVRFFTDLDDFCENHPEVVIISTAILSLEGVLASLPLQRLKRSTLFVDVLSVKEFARKTMLRTLPPEADILCTHPMFGPDSGRGSWAGLNFMYEIVRLLPDDPERAQRMQDFIRVSVGRWRCLFGWLMKRGADGSAAVGMRKGSGTVGV